MAQKVNVVVTDDFDGTEGASTVRFGLDGVEYEVDLTPEHEEQLRGFLNAYVGVGRKVASGARSVRRVSKRAAGGDTNAIRTWARANGYEIGDRGRISQEVKDAYHAAKGGTPAPDVSVDPQFSQV